MKYTERLERHKDTKVKTRDARAWRGGGEEEEVQGENGGGGERRKTTRMETA